MAQKRSQSLRSMSLTALRKEAASRGIKGLSKADRETVYRTIRSTAAQPTMNAARHANYIDQNWAAMRSEHITPRQARRILKHENRAKGRA